MSHAPKATTRRRGASGLRLFEAYQRHRGPPEAGPESVEGDDPNKEVSPYSG